MISSLSKIVTPRLLGVGIICGLFGMAIDLDHLPKLITGEYINAIYLVKGFFDNGSLNQGRPLHNLIMLIACLVLTSAVTLLLQYNVRLTARNFIATCTKAVASILVTE